MSNDEIIRRIDALEALYEQAAFYDPDTLDGIEEVAQFTQINEDISSVEKIKALPFRLHELTEVEICGLHGDCVIVSAPTIDGLDKRVVPCLGSHKDIDGKKYIVLDGEEYSQSLFVDGTITLWQVR